MIEFRHSDRVSIWRRLFQISGGILGLGALLGAYARARHGREFTNGEVGIWLWPLAIGYLLSLLYALSYLVFTAVKGRLRYLVIPLWVLAMALLVLGLGSIFLEKLAGQHP